MCCYGNGLSKLSPRNLAKFSIPPNQCNPPLSLLPSPLFFICTREVVSVFLRSPEVTMHCSSPPVRLCMPLVEEGQATEGLSGASAVQTGCPPASKGETGSATSHPLTLTTNLLRHSLSLSLKFYLPSLPPLPLCRPLGFPVLPRHYLTLVALVATAAYILTS